MPQTSLFEIMQASTIVDRTQPRPTEPETPTATVLKTDAVFMLFDFQSEIYAIGRKYNFRVQKGIMPLRGDLFKHLKDAYRCRKVGHKTLEITWPTASMKSVAVRNAKAYIGAIDTLWATKDKQTKLKHSEHLQSYLMHSKGLLEGLVEDLQEEN